MIARSIEAVLPILIAAVAGHGLSAQVSARGAASRPSAKADAHGIKMDAQSKATLDAWEKMEYHLGRAGVKTMSFKVKVDAKSPMGNVEATGTYSFDGKKGKLKWDDAGFGAMLAQRGWSRESFDRLVIADSHRRSLKGAELTARKKDGMTILDVKGDTKGGYKAFYYDAAGVARKFSMLVDDNTGGKAEAVISLTYEKVGKHHVRNGWSFQMKHPMGAFLGRVTIENKKVGRFWVYGTIKEEMEMGGQPFGSATLTFTDYKINGSIVEKANGDGKPASKPTSKPGKAEPKGRPKSNSGPKR